MLLFRKSLGKEEYFKKNLCLWTFSSMEWKRRCRIMLSLKSLICREWDTNSIHGGFNIRIDGLRMIICSAFTKTSCQHIWNHILQNGSQDWDQTKLFVSWISLEEDSVKIIRSYSSRSHNNNHFNVIQYQAAALRRGSFLYLQRQLNYFKVNSLRRQEI